MKIKLSLSIGYPTANRTEVMEVEDDMTEKELEEVLQEWAMGFMDYSYEVIK